MRIASSYLNLFKMKSLSWSSPPGHFCCFLDCCWIMLATLPYLPGVKHHQIRPMHWKGQGTNSLAEISSFCMSKASKNLYPVLFQLGWECPGLVVPTFLFFWDTRGTRVGTRGTCPQNGVPKALKNEDTGHKNPRLRDTKDTLTYISLRMVKSLKQPSLNMYFKYLQHHHHPY